MAPQSKRQEILLQSSARLAGERFLLTVPPARAHAARHGELADLGADDTNHETTRTWRPGAEFLHGHGAPIVRCTFAPTALRVEQIAGAGYPSDR